MGIYVIVHCIVGIQYKSPEEKMTIYINIFKSFLHFRGKCVWPSMVTHTRNLCSAFNPSKCTYTRSSGQPIAPGEQLGVRCLAQGSHLSRGIEGGESPVYSLPTPTIAAGPETRTCDLRVTSPTLYPLGHDCPLLE